MLPRAPGANAGNTCGTISSFSESDHTAAPGAGNIKKHEHADVECPNPEAPKEKEGWRIWKAASLPTVKVIVADLELCGIVTSDDNTIVFYSFGAGSPSAKMFAKELEKQPPKRHGKNINDIMSGSWFDALGKWPELREQASGSGQQTWIARSCQALAKMAKGKVYLMAKPGTNIYTDPLDAYNEDWGWRGPHNVWSDFEFATLQANKEVNGIYTVNSETLKIDDSTDGSWLRDRTPQGEKAKYNVDADTVPVESINKLKKAWKEKNDKKDDGKSGDDKCKRGRNRNGDKCRNRNRS